MNKEQYIRPIVDTMTVETEQMFAGSISVSSNEKELFQGDNRTNRASEFNENLW